MLNSALGPKGPGGLIGKVLNRLPLPGRTVEHHAFAGNGLQFQAQAVRDAVTRGEISSPIMPLEHSAAVANIVSTVLESNLIRSCSEPYRVQRFRQHY